METTKKKSNKKWIIIIAVILIVVIVAVLVVPRILRSNMPSAAAINSATVTTGTVATTVESSGNLTENHMEITIPYDVTVNDILVDEGDYVNDGDKIATVYSSSLEDKIDDVDDLIDDIDEKIGEQESNEENIAALKERRTELKEVRKALNNVAKNNAIYSSGNGVVGEISISESSKLSSTDDSDSMDDSTDTTSADTNTSSDSSSSMVLSSIKDDYFGIAVTIKSNDTVAMEVDIDELDISSVKTGQEAEITVDAVEGETFTGKVTKINSDININNGVVKYSAKVELSKSSEMKTGMSASVTITKESNENVLTIPADAVQESADGVYVYTTNEDDTLGGQTLIETGLSDGSTVEVTSGLSEGDTVYYMVVSSDSSTENMMMPGGGMGGMMNGGGGGERPNGEGGSGGPPDTDGGSGSAPRSSQQ